MFKKKTCRNYKSITGSCTLKGVCDLYPLFKWHICTGPGDNIPLDEPFPPPPGRYSICLMAYTWRLAPKGVPFSGFRFISKGRDFSI